MNQQSLGQQYFDRLYAGDADPWQFESSAYEADKYAVTLAALPRERYRSAIEVGCSIGVLTRMLAPRCGQILGLDIAQAAIGSARKRCADMPQVRFEVAAFPDSGLTAQCDLILLSEVLYYFGPTDIAAVADKIREIAMPEADIVCVHWLGPTPDYPMTGDQAMDAFEHALGTPEIIQRIRQKEYRLDILRLPPAG
jgi:SAM-dependent methyltransferase